MKLELKVRILSKRVAEQIEKKSTLTVHQVDAIVGGIYKSLGWTWCSALDWSTGLSKALLIEVNPGEYFWTPWNQEHTDPFKDKDIPQIFL